MPETTKRKPGEIGAGSNPQKRRTTITQIAEQAGVSIGLISSFLTGRDYRSRGRSGIRIAPATAERIRQTCRDMGYWPEKPSAFNRIYPELSEICLMGPASDVGFQGNRYFSMILHGVLDAALNAGSKTSIAYFDGNIDYRKFPELLPFPVLDPGVDKFILSAAPNYSLIEALVERGKQVVYISRRVDVPEVASIVPDYQQAARLALEYLAGLGHRQIGFLASTFFKDSYNAEELLAGIRKAMKDLHLLCPGSDLHPESRSMEDTVDQLFSRQDPPTAIFAYDDYSAEMAMKLLQERGLSIPDDVSIVGCNDEREAALTNPPLTTVHLQSHELGRGAVELVNRMLISANGDYERHQILPVNLVERASAKPLAG